MQVHKTIYFKQVIGVKLTMLYNINKIAITERAKRVLGFFFLFRSDRASTVSHSIGTKSPTRSHNIYERSHSTETRVFLLHI